MTLPTQQCDLHLLQQLVEHQLDGDQAVAVEEHLSRCISCQKAVEAMAGSTQFWQTAESRLSPEHSMGIAPYANSNDAFHNESDPPNSNPASTALPELDLSEPSTTAVLRYVAQLLGPTDEPQSMGRLGAYEVHGLIGIGGMGIVVKAFDRSLNRFVAIKILSPSMAIHGSARQRFSREAMAAAAVTHENVLAIHAIESWQGTPYLVMPYVNGQSLEKRLSENGPLEINSILRIGLQIASGLAEAHAQGLVHRDIKPANILLSQGSERLKISDFGLARAADDASFTRSGTITGTPTYMSPEQARGDSIDQRSDIFSFGTLLYELCTGHPPFRAETPFGIIQRICNHKPRPIHDSRPNVPIWLCGIIDAMLEKKLTDRIQSTAELTVLFRVGLNFLQEPDGTPLPDAFSRFVPVEKTPLGTTRNFTVGMLVVIALTIVVLATASFSNDNRTIRFIKNDPQSFGKPFLMASQIPIVSHDESFHPTQQTIAPEPLERTRPSYQFSVGEKVEYRIAIEIQRNDGSINVDGTLQMVVVAAEEDTFELKYSILLEYDRVGSSFQSNPFQTSAIEGEIAQLRRLEKLGRIKVSRFGEIIGRSQESELPAQLGPIADLLFPSFDFRESDTDSRSLRLCIRSLPTSLGTGPWSGIASVDCNRSTSLRLASQEQGDRLLNIEAVIEDELSVDVPVTGTTTGNYVFDQNLGRMTRLTFQRDTDFHADDHFAKLNFELALVDQTQPFRNQK